MRTVLENLAKKTNSTEIESLECADDSSHSYVCVDLQTSYCRLLGDEEVDSVRERRRYCFEDCSLGGARFWYELCHQCLL